MLRIIVNSFVAVVLLFTSAGLTISKHYCGDMLVSVAIDGNAKSCCGTTCNCCHNENLIIQLKDDFLIQQAPAITNAPVFEYNLAFVQVSDKIRLTPINEINPEITGSPPFIDLLTTQSFLRIFRC
jgi:hypothetical protein